MDKFSVGYDRQVVEPDESIPLSGFSNEDVRYHTRMTEDICATCVALTDTQDNTVMLIGFDCVRIMDYFGENVRRLVSDATGIPQDRIYLAATHTHSSPGFIKEKNPVIQRYVQKSYKLIVLAAQNAMADRKPARMQVGSIETECLNFIKHYRVRDPETGEICYIGDQYGTKGSRVYVDHATKVDPTMHLVRFIREGGKDVVIANFRAHPHFTGGYKKYDLSSDYVGTFRTSLEASADCHALYLQGACGNVNSSSRLPDERRFTSVRSYGAALASYAVQCLDQYMRDVQTGPIKTQQQKVFGELYRYSADRVEGARIVHQKWRETYDRALVGEMGIPYDIHSPYHAGAILASQNRTEEEHGWMIINAMCIGDSFGLVTFPGEMYDSVSVRMEENSPYWMTMMMGYCHHHIGYLPSAVAYKYGSYEVDITRFAAGTGEMVADKQVEMLRQLKEQ